MRGVEGGDIKRDLNMIQTCNKRVRGITLFTLLALGLTIVTTTIVLADPREQAKRMHERLTGVPPEMQTLNSMAQDIAAGNPGGAADRAISNPNFYNVKLKNFVTPWTNKARSVFEPLNDYTATVIGMIRDDYDFREVLYGDVIYVGSDPRLPAYANNNNNHYSEMERLGIDLQADLVAQTQSVVTGLPVNATSGVITTRAAAKAFFYAGTSRAMFYHTILNHLCKTSEEIRDVTRPSDRIRQDPSRSPGGDSRVWLTNCIGCHAGMSGLMGGWAYYDYLFDAVNDPNGDNGQLLYTQDVVQGKYLINADNFRNGYITIDDSWVNYWRNGPNAFLGWGSPSAGVTLDSKGNSYGSGAKSLGQELANTTAFARCQVKKVLKAVCLRDPGTDPNGRSDETQITTMVNSFINNGYNMKQVFNQAAVYCMGD